MKAKALVASVYVVDDEIDVLDSISILLDALGLNVKCYTSAEAFLKNYQPSETECLILDVMMPTMSGLDLAKECRVIRPNLPIIVISGLEERTVSEDASYYDEWTNKPITPSLLALALSRVLDAKASK